MYLIDLTHTSHCRAHTGIQRVSRCLYAELSRMVPLLPVCYDRFAKCWRPLNNDEAVYLRPPTEDKPDSSRGQRWTLGQRSRGYLNLLRGHTGRLEGQRYAGLIAPEIFSESVGEAYAQLRPLLDGPMVAICHDLLAITHPSLSTEGARTRFPGYLEHLLMFDGIAANSASTRDSLTDYWDQQGRHDRPRVESVPLGTDIAEASPSPLPQGRKARILCVGTLEARKNHTTLLDAADLLWRRGIDFELTLVGMVNLETGSAAMRRVIAMEKEGRPVKWLGAVSEKRLREEYARCHFTVYPSIAEGFGLPVAESIRFGRPCVTANSSAIVEQASGGGCVLVDTTSPSSLAAGIAKLLDNRKLLESLASEARSRKLRTWHDYAGDLLACVRQWHSETVASVAEDAEASLAKSI